jgi:hypothetical protein
VRKIRPRHTRSMARPRGKPLSVEHRRKISAGHRAIPMTRRAQLAANLRDKKTLHGHGASRLDPARLCTPTYISWAQIIGWCCNPRFSGYRLYGGRGIRVCGRWHDPRGRGRENVGFRNFLADMGERPPGCTIGRVGPDGDFMPENCRWVVSTRTRAERNPSRAGRTRRDT